jgi:hypothetical protein
MNGYKVYILTLAVAVFTWVDLWFRLPESSRVLVNVGVMSFSLGVIIAGIVFCYARFLWWGKVVEFTIYPPPGDSPSVLPCLAQLEEKIFKSAEDAAKGIGDRKMNWMSGQVARHARHTRNLSLLCVPIGSFAGWLVFIWVRPLSIWTWIYLGGAIAGSLFSLGSIDP